MAEMISSAVAHEAVNQVLSSIKERYEGNSGAKGHMERMEMAHIKLEAALETSDKWIVTSVPLIHWRRKLKRAAQECDDMLRNCKKRLQREEEIQHMLSNSSFPMRIAHTTRSLAASIFNYGHNKLSLSTVRRFEWYAEGASEFVRYMELGGTPHRYMFFDPLVRHLLEGKGTKYFLVRGDQRVSFHLRPFGQPGYGVEGRLMFLLQDGNAPEKNFVLAVHLRLTERTNIVGVIVRCMQLFTSHLGSTVETVKTEVTQLPVQDFTWAPYDFSVCSCKEHSDNLHTIVYKWFRPNPLCCQQQDYHHTQSYPGRSTISLTESLPCDMYLESVTEVYLQGYIALSSGREISNSKTGCTRNFPYLKLAGLILPHATLEDLSPAVRSSASEMINDTGTAHCGLYANICFEQLGGIVLPNAKDFFCRNAAATSYQMFRKPKHEGTYFRVEETLRRKTDWKGKVGKSQELQGKMAQERTSEIVVFISTLVAHAPVHLQGSISDESEKEKLLPTLMERGHQNHDTDA